MMDISSIIDAGLALGGAISVVLIGKAMVSSDSTTVSSDSTTVSTSSDETGCPCDDTPYPPLQAAA